MANVKYETALAVVRAATAKWSKVQAAYRAREIDDAAFLAARAEYMASDAAFEAVAVEVNK